MKIRTKLMLSMSILIVFIMLSLLAITHIQFYIDRDLVYLEEKALFDSLRDEFEQYYVNHGESWDGIGVQAGAFEHSRDFVEIGLVIEDKMLYQQGSLHLRDLRDQGYKLTLYGHNEQKIGRLYVMNDAQYKTYEFKAMWYSILPAIARVSILFTCLAALVTIFILSWRLTRPIREIIKGIDLIKGGKQEVSFPIHRKDEFGAISRALQEMNDSLTTLERSRKQLLSDVTHELKTPLMIIQGELELAQDTGIALSIEKQSSLLDEVLRLTRMVNEVLDLSKLEAGGTKLYPKTENIVMILNQLVEKTQFLAEDKHIRLTTHISEEVIEVSVEKQRILQALYNLLINALHYTNQEGYVKLHVDRVYRQDRQNEYVRIVIEDNGTGIPEEDLPLIFNRFYRADHSRARPSGGTGLGLAIAQQNIFVHQGWIEVQSTVGKGTAFSVFLPSLPVVSK
ncbi:two-component system sensor histidine kinase BaeS [Brevibacillus sp. AG162]|uniref:sensor histidine kinase n=1 Tax=Brevibacillus sp. AG162 TaxID=2572910 RepID=UPI00114D9E3D|nr:HAMP domain-containing sensor histidine kinase [Brevibacillus sp. AG162]TQK74035.1 two-component system sensor histidine kinase BaeS [Brevibacillus sp. AG162]